MLNSIESFVLENGFVNPEKLTAVDVFGLEKAKELFSNGGPDFKTLENLRIISLNKYLLGEL